MNQPQIKSFGEWKSPITSDLIVSSSIGLSAVKIDQNNNIYWLESRPQEKGRNVIVKYNSQGEKIDITPTSFNVRTRVHEYGGGAFLITENKVYFSNFTDQQIYIQDLTNLTIPPQQLTNSENWRFADSILDEKRHNLIGVGEYHDPNLKEPENCLVTIDLITGNVTKLVTGNDFYTSPKLSPNGNYLAWISWNHPNLPWDGTFLSIGKVENNGSLTEIKVIAGGQNESICEVKWSPENELYFASDKTGWWNLYHVNEREIIEPLHPAQCEFGYPHWVFGESIFDFISDSNLLCTYTENGVWKLARLNGKTKNFQDIKLPFSSISYLQVNQNKAVFIGGSATQPTAVVKLDLNSDKFEILCQSTTLEIEDKYLSIPQQIAFPSSQGIAYGWYYPPKNDDFISLKGELPPLLVKSHGGPTASASSSFNLRIQYWTSRGFAFLDVNYGGSTGYGRAYRERLDYNWGIVDVEDCVNGAEYLAQQGKVDREKLAIAGGSAGGYTTLAALTFHNTFKAGASYYGVSDLEALATDTHKFEARYLDRLIGKYPEDKEVYIKRSPINHTELLSCPVIFFQGLEDKVVPPNQAEMMVKVLQEKGLPVAYVAFEGEQHGFRQAQNIKRSLDGEFYFYGQIFGFKPAEEIESVEIINF
jgi:dipeptidyl aminopeptidase/acylaminoacyl peptidase